MSDPSSPLDLTLISQQLTEAHQQIQTLSERLTLVEDQLILISDVDKYSPLQRFLKAGDFKAADRETTAVILATASKQRDTLTPDDMSKFPCTVLQVIDRLWKTYSQGRFGFSVQLSIYLEIGGSIDTLRAQDVPLINQFCDRVGWYDKGVSRANNYEQWDFSLAAHLGAYPAAWWKSPYGLKMATYCFMRLLECQIRD
jgi:hypothetical protein